MTAPRFKTINISGFPAGYEAACQKMLRNGLRWLALHPDFDFTTYHEYKGVYGLIVGDNDLAKDLDKAVIGDLDATGAMHHAVIRHLGYIHKHGYDSWIQEIQQRDSARVYEIDEDAIDAEIKKAKDEWEAELARGHNRTIEMLNEWGEGKKTT